MADDIHRSSSQNTAYKTRANESFDFLCTIRGNLNSEEREALFALSIPENVWKWAAFDWLETKRRKYDPSYDALRAKEADLAKATSRLHQLEQEQALQALALQEATGASVLQHGVLEKAYAYLRAQGKI